MLELDEMAALHNGEQLRHCFSCEMVFVLVRLLVTINACTKLTCSDANCLATRRMMIMLTKMITLAGCLLFDCSQTMFLNFVQPKPQHLLLLRFIIMNCVTQFNHISNDLSNIQHRFHFTSVQFNSIKNQIQQFH